MKIEIDTSKMGLNGEHREVLDLTCHFAKSYDSFDYDQRHGALEDVVKCAGLLLQAVELIQKDKMPLKIMEEGLTKIAIRLMESMAMHGFLALNLLEDQLGNPMTQSVLKAYAIEKMQENEPSLTPEEIIQMAREAMKNTQKN